MKPVKINSAIRTRFHRFRLRHHAALDEVVVEIHIVSRAGGIIGIQMRAIEHISERTITDNIASISFCAAINQNAAGFVVGPTVFNCMPGPG